MYKKRSYGKKKVYRGVKRTRYGKKAQLRGMVPGVHRFKETCELTAWSAAAGSTQFGCQSYKLRDLFNVANFTGLFDMFKISGVKLTIVPQFNTSSVLDANAGIGGNVGNLPILYIAPNRSPWSVAPTSVQDVLNDDGCKVIRLDKKVSFYLKSPAPQIVDGAGTGVPVMTNVGTRLWLTTGGNGQTVDQTSVLHFGHRWSIENTNSTGITVKVYATYYFKMKEMD